MDMVTITLDGIQVKARQGSRILETAMDAGVYIPHLCFLSEADPPIGACRLCFVEIEGRIDAVTACTTPVAGGMIVRTNTPRVDRLRRTAAELIIANHHVDCKACARNRSCELQKVAAHLKLKLKPQRLRKTLGELKPVDSSHPLLTYDPNKCVLCGKCVWICEHKVSGPLNFAFRGFQTRVSTFDQRPLGESKCDSCEECAAVCPVGALVSKVAK
ncbi:MAG TPA: ferredoxin [Dehalococcoidia bacterium]|nr:ferredoxin [Dehalococcoidia bacterium]